MVNQTVQNVSMTQNGFFVKCGIHRPLVADLIKHGLSLSSFASLNALVTSWRVINCSISLPIGWGNNFSLTVLGVTSLKVDSDVTAMVGRTAVPATSSTVTLYFWSHEFWILGTVSKQNEITESRITVTEMTATARAAWDDSGLSKRNHTFRCSDLNVGSNSPPNSSSFSSSETWMIEDHNCYNWSLIVFHSNTLIRSVIIIIINS